MLLRNLAFVLFCLFNLSQGLSLVPSLLRFGNDIKLLFGMADKGVVEEGDVALSLNLPGERPIPGGSPITQCDVVEPQILELYSVEVDPMPPIRGENLTFSAKGSLSKSIKDGAYVEVDVRYGFIRLVHQTFDLCEEITKVDLECPIKKGIQSITKEVEIPQEVPAGRYIVNAKAFTKDDEYITCLSAAFDIPPAN